ncbi:MAG: T9SS type A sorting domain-containing protein [Bacteroidia bacterium]|nr:T9SS type A sorting domain-containing protein [Bacteroidia bacterium]
MNCKFKIFFTNLLLSLTINLFAQDTITVMQYNLLQYDYATSSCIPIADKTSNLKITLKYIKPDILGCNEMTPDYTAVDYLLNNALNTDGVTYYQKTSYTNLAGSSIVNMLYYNSQKLGFVSQRIIQTDQLRDINVYKLYYKAPDLQTTQDTAYIQVIIAHLKASQGYEAERTTETLGLMNNLDSINIPHNYLCQGDFNLYTSTEQAYQNLIAYSNTALRFYDPINRPGSWHGTYSFSDIHTQATHTSGSCFITGGLDDRFDFILISNDVRLGNKKVKYIPGTYKTIGQDGQHFNQPLNSPANNSLPSNVINALYNTSDHLPVMLKLKMNPTGQSVTSNQDPVRNITFNNPVNETLPLEMELEKNTDLTVQIVSILGNILYTKKLSTVSGTVGLMIPFNHPKGIYFLRISDQNSHALIKKIIKN